MVVPTVLAEDAHIIDANQIYPPQQDNTLALVLYQPCWPAGLIAIWAATRPDHAAPSLEVNVSSVVPIGGETIQPANSLASEDEVIVVTDPDDNISAKKCLAPLFDAAASVDILVIPKDTILTPEDSSFAFSDTSYVPVRDPLVDLPATSTATLRVTSNFNEVLPPKHSGHISLPTKVSKDQG
jgi:hypothetical protein